MVSRLENLEIFTIDTEVAKLFINNTNSPKSQIERSTFLGRPESNLFFLLAFLEL